MARRRRRELPLNAEINVVSLIDVMLLLLVIFMITAPMMQGGVDVALPKAEAKPLEPKSGLVVSVDRAGWVYVDETRMSLVGVPLGVPDAGRQARGGRRVSARRCGRAVRRRHAGAGDDARRRRGRHRPRDRSGHAEVTRTGGARRTVAAHIARRGPRCCTSRSSPRSCSSRAPAHVPTPPTYRVNLVAAPPGPRQVGVVRADTAGARRPRRHRRRPRQRLARARRRSRSA